MELKIDGCNFCLFDRNRHGGRVACYMRNDSSFTKRNYFPHETEAIFIAIFIYFYKFKTKPLTVDTIYRLLSQTSFFEAMNEYFNQLDTIKKEAYILGGFNINLSLDNEYVFEKRWIPVLNIIPYDVPTY